MLQRRISLFQISCKHGIGNWSSYPQVQLGTRVGSGQHTQQRMENRVQGSGQPEHSVTCCSLRQGRGEVSSEGLSEHPESQ